VETVTAAATAEAAEPEPRDDTTALAARETPAEREPPPAMERRAPAAVERPRVERREAEPVEPPAPPVERRAPARVERDPSAVAALRPPRAATSRRTETPTASPQEDVRWLLERYAAAWRARDLQALRDLGQVANERAAEGLRRYFAEVEDFDVEVDLLGLRSEGGRTIVEFVRRDRFRDPSGRLVVKESPPIEKEVVQTPNGLRFAPGRG